MNEYMEAIQRLNELIENTENEIKAIGPIRFTQEYYDLCDEHGQKLLRLEIEEDRFKVLYNGELTRVGGYRSKLQEDMEYRNRYIEEQKDGKRHQGRMTSGDVALCPCCCKPLTVLDKQELQARIKGLKEDIARIDKRVKEIENGNDHHKYKSQGELIDKLQKYVEMKSELYSVMLKEAKNGKE